MTTGFSYELSTDIGKLRLYIGDHREDDGTAGVGARSDGSNFTDEELSTFISEENNDWRRAAALACEALALEWANLVDVTLGPRREAMSMVSKQFASRAKQLREQYGGSEGSGTSFYAGMVREDGYSEQ